MSFVCCHGHAWSIEEMEIVAALSSSEITNNFATK